MRAVFEHFQGDIGRRVMQKMQGITQGPDGLTREGFKPLQALRREGF